MKLSDSIAEIPGIGPKYQQLLENLNILTIEDLLWHVPFRYEDRSNIKEISQLIVGEKATVIVTIDKISNIFTKYGKRLTRATVSDESGKLEVIWFNQTYLPKSLPGGSTVKLYGEISLNSKKPQFVSPEYEAYSEEENPNSPYLPVYSTTSGISNKWIKGKIQYALENTDIEENLTESIRKNHNLIDKKSAFRNIHIPEDLSEIEKSKERLAFEELLILHLRGLSLKTRWEDKKNSHKIKLSSESLNSFKSSLPFELTNGQNNAIKEILQDLEGEIPMNRLLQGDVGSGKTVVGAAAILAAAHSNFNTIFMAPTQILAKQHFETLQKVLKSQNINVLLLTGKDKKIEPKEPYVVVATQSILHNLEKFQNVGLIIIDEQHKFGVEQRSIVIDHYTEKNEISDKIPNLLTMTATPIPRSLALTFYGELDLSVIDEVPKSRKGVQTWVINESKRKDSYQWIAKQIQETKTQVFVVCPFIEESENENFQNVKSAESEYEKLTKIFKNLNIGLLHGRIKSDEKDKVITQMLNKEIDILVTTPVIEVGVDIPNANIIYIETPERFGLASLHQLRGRVGRGNQKGYCFLITSTKSPDSMKRLKYMETINNGNKLAEIDLELRGPGDIYGRSQHGFLDLKVAEINNIDLIKSTKKAAFEIFKDFDKYADIKSKVEKGLIIEDN